MIIVAFVAPIVRARKMPISQSSQLRKFPDSPILYNLADPMATAFPPAGQPGAERIPFGMRLHNFWRRVTEGLEVSQLWSQFESEARTSYRLYSRDVEAKTPEGLTSARPPPACRQGILLGGVRETLARAPRLAAAGADSSGDPARRLRIYRRGGQSPGHRIRSALLGGAAAVCCC